MGELGRLHELLSSFRSSKQRFCICEQQGIHASALTPRSCRMYVHQPRSHFPNP